MRECERVVKPRLDGRLATTRAQAPVLSARSCGHGTRSRPWEVHAQSDASAIARAEIEFLHRPLSSFYTARALGLHPLNDGLLHITVNAHCGLWIQTLKTSFCSELSSLPYLSADCPCSRVPFWPLMCRVRTLLNTLNPYSTMRSLSTGRRRAWVWWRCGCAHAMLSPCPSPVSALAPVARIN